MKIATSLGLLALFVAGCSNQSDTSSPSQTAAPSSDRPGDAAAPIEDQAQLQAELACARAAMNSEMKRTPGLKTLSPRKTDIRVLGDKHYLVVITYKKITLDDPGETTSDWDMNSGATCEVLNGKVVDGKLKETFAETLEKLNDS